MPNAGKSTLLSVVSAARPKIADYPFTTLEPQLGVVRVSDEESFVMVDVPGLIEGAHAGAGLGDQFLQARRAHARARASARRREAARRNSRTTKTTIERELGAWNPTLLEKPTLLVVNKLDLPDARERFDELRERFPEMRGISAATGEGVRELIYAVGARSSSAPMPEVVAPAPAPIELVPPDAFVHRARTATARSWSAGERIERLAAMTDFDSDEGAGALRTRARKDGRRKKTARAGRREGDTVRIGPYEFTYS